MNIAVKGEKTDGVHDSEGDVPNPRSQRLSENERRGNERGADDVRSAVFDLLLVLRERLVQYMALALDGETERLNEGR